MNQERYALHNPMPDQVSAYVSVFEQKRGGPRDTQISSVSQEQQEYLDTLLILVSALEEQRVLLGD